MKNNKSSSSKNTDRMCNLPFILLIITVIGLLMVLYLNNSEIDNFESPNDLSINTNTIDTTYNSNCKNIKMNDMPIYTPLKNLSSPETLSTLLPENRSLSGYSSQHSAPLPEFGKENLRENGSLLFVSDADRAKIDPLASQTMYSY